MAFNDVSTMLLMRRFYEALTSFPPASALRAAQHDLRTMIAAEVLAAVQTLARQDKRLASPAAQSPADEMATLLEALAQLPPQTRPFAHDYYWAPFVYYGWPG